MRKLRSLSGFSQMRIEYRRPNCCVWPTPGMRGIGSSTCAATMLLSSSDGTLLSLERRLTRHEEAGVHLRDLQALQHHVARQPRLGERHAVLRLHRRGVRVRCRSRTPA